MTKSGSKKKNKASVSANDPFIIQGIETFGKQRPALWASTAAQEDLLASEAIDGMTPSLAKRLVQQLKAQTIEDILTSDEKAKSILADRWDKVSDDLYDLNEAGALPLMVWLRGVGFSGTMVRKTIQWLKNESEGIKPPQAFISWSKDPHSLSEIPGITFERADQIALKLGCLPNSEARLIAAAREALRKQCDDAGGGASLSTVKNITATLLRSNNALSVPEAHTATQEAMSLAVKKGTAKFATDEDGSELIFSADLYEAEERSSHLLLKMSQDQNHLSKEDLDQRVKQLEVQEQLTLSDEQRNAIETVFKGRISIICGKPGAGKTTLLKCLGPLLEQKGKIFYAAPTGKAAKRMSQALKRHASTIHRLLNIGMQDDFADTKNGIKDADAIILDEASMIDSKMLHRILKSLGPQTALIFLGDPDQLPSVGAGKVLKDLIDSKALPVAMLNEPRRASANSAINIVARTIGRGEYMDFRDKTQDCVWLDEPKPAQIATRIANILLGNASKKYDPIKDVQVITPSNKGAAGVAELNIALQKALNPPAKDKPEWEIKEGLLLRLGDKVMQTTNDYEKDVVDLRGSEPKATKGIFNGDVGYVTGFEMHGSQKKVKVTFDTGDVLYDLKEASQSLTLAYACTVHKFQGSEAPLIFVAVPADVAHPLRTRNSIYTAITRAKEKCIVIGEESVLRTCIKRDALSTRKTRLKGLLTGAITVDISSSGEVKAISEGKALHLAIAPVLNALREEEVAVAGFDEISRRIDGLDAGPAEPEEEKPKRRARSL